MDRTLKTLLLTALILATASAPAAAESGVGLRGGVGTDITGGIAYGGGLNFLSSKDASGAWEMGLVAYGGSFEETTTETYTYDEKTDVIAVGVLVNRLFRYSPGMRGAFTALGVGAGAVSVKWEERSEGDTSLGTPLPGGGSMQAEEGTAGGLIVNLGVGYSFGGPFDMRIETPIIFVTGAPGGATSVLPTFTLTAGLRF